MPSRSRSTGAWFVRHSIATVESRSIPRPTRSSRPSRRRREALVAAGGSPPRPEGGPIRVRMGVHTGSPLHADERIRGRDVHRAARIAAAGTVVRLVEAPTAALVDGQRLHDLGEHRVQGPLAAPRAGFSSAIEEFPPIRRIYRTNLPVPATAFLGRDGSSRRSSRCWPRPRAPADADRARRHRQDAARAPGGRRGAPTIPRRGLVGAARAGDRCGARGPVASRRASRWTRRPGGRLDDTRHGRTLGASDARSSTTPSICCRAAAPARRASDPARSHGARHEPGATPRSQASTCARCRRSPSPTASGCSPRARVGRRLPPSAGGRGALPQARQPPARARARRRRATAIFSPEQMLERIGSGSTSSRATATPTRASRRSGRRSPGRTSSSTREQRLFARLSVFAGGCSLEAAERSAAPTSTRSSPCSTRASSAAGASAAYWMLETIREFAAEQLAASGEAERIARRHLAYYLALAEDVDERRAAGEYELGRIEEERDNLRRASIPRLHSTPSRRSSWRGGLASTGTGEATSAKGGRGSQPLLPRLPLLKPRSRPCAQRSRQSRSSGRRI